MYFSFFLNAASASRNPPVWYLSSVVCLYRGEEYYNPCTCQRASSSLKSTCAQRARTQLNAGVWRGAWFRSGSTGHTHTKKRRRRPPGKLCGFFCACDWQVAHLCVESSQARQPAERLAVRAATVVVRFRVGSGEIFVFFLFKQAPAL